MEKKPHALESIRRHTAFSFAKGCATAHKDRCSIFQSLCLATFIPLWLLVPLVSAFSINPVQGKKIASSRANRRIYARVLSRFASEAGQLNWKMNPDLKK
jgi:hypothetical protein